MSSPEQTILEPPSQITPSQEEFFPVQISEFFADYPDVRDPLFNSKISRKEEFAELAPSATEAPPPRGKGYKHQNFSVRFLTWYNRELLVHDPGTGKSCIIVHSAELFKNEYLKDPNDPTKIKRAIILLRGPTLEENIRNEIVCKCTDRIYETDLVLRATDEIVRKSNLTRALKTWYDIMTYEVFANEIRKFTREEDLEEYMSNKVIYVDEVHNVPTLEDHRHKRYPLTIAESAGESVYQTIFRAFHKGKRNKIVLATATPMINSPTDIIALINLILPLDLLMPSWSEEQINNITLEEIEPYFRGRVSYIRALETGAQKEPIGQSPQGFYTKIFPCDMSPFQYAAYLRAAAGARSKFHNDELSASNFVFPDDDYGKNAFWRYIDLIGGQYQFKPDANGTQIRSLLRNDDGLATLSGKYFNIVELCLQSWPDAEIITNDNKGIIFVYFSKFVHGSGAVMLGMALREHGYEEFNENSDIFYSTQVSQRPFELCPSEIENRVERYSRIPKRPRYALLHGKTDRARIHTILNTLNSYENRYGHYIQILIGSKVAREGININNAIKMVMASGSWNQSSNEQAEYRVFRSTSHVVRIDEKGAHLIERGGDANQVTIQVKTYNMASIYIGDPQAEEEVFRRNNVDTIDARLYMLAETKDRSISRIMRFLKQSSIDCYINRARNIRPNDVDFSPQCDFERCDYECTGIRRDIIDRIDRTTKILYYSSEEVENSERALKQLFSRFYSLKIDQIHRSIRNIDPIFVDMAIEKMIEENIRVTDRMGYFGYLRESPNGVIYLEKDQFEVRSQPENTAYTSVLIGIQDPQNNSFNDYITGLDATSELPALRRLLQIEPDDVTFVELLDSLSLISKVSLLEYVIYQQKSTGQTNDLFDAIVSTFNHAIYTMPEPVSLLRQTAINLANRGKGRGRKPNPNTRPKLKKLGITGDFPLPEYDPNVPAEHVYIHTLLNQGGHDRTSYSVTSRFFKAEGQLRILKMSEGIGWRNVNQYEYEVYNNNVQRMISQIRAYYEQFPIYGIMIPPEKRFHIRDREGEDPDRARRDARTVNDGRVCRTWLKPELINILYRLNLTLNQGQPPSNMTRDDLINYLRAKSVGSVSEPLENFPDDKLAFFYVWYQSNFSRDDICEFIKRYFERTGRLFTGKMPTALLQQTGQVGSIQIGAPLTSPDYAEGTPTSASIEVSSPEQPTPGTVHKISIPVSIPQVSIQSTSPLDQLTS